MGSILYKANLASDQAPTPPLEGHLEEAHQEWGLTWLQPALLAQPGEQQGPLECPLESSIT